MNILIACCIVIWNDLESLFALGFIALCNCSCILVVNNTVILVAVVEAEYYFRDILCGSGRCCGSCGSCCRTVTGIAYSRLCCMESNLGDVEDFVSRKACKLCTAEGIDVELLELLAIFLDDIIFEGCDIRVPL